VYYCYVHVFCPSHSVSLHVRSCIRTLSDADSIGHGGTVSRTDWTANRKLTKLYYWPSRKRSTKTTNCICRAKKAEGHDKFFFWRFVDVCPTAPLSDSFRCHCLSCVHRTLLHERLRINFAARGFRGFKTTVCNSLLEQYIGLHSSGKLLADSQASRFVLFSEQWLWMPDSLRDPSVESERFRRNWKRISLPDNETWAH